MREQRALHADVPILGFAAYSGTGKTTTLKKLLPHLTDVGLRVGMIKLSHHKVEIDKPGKDSYELRKAGACQMVLAAHKCWALMVEKAEPSEPVLQEMVDALHQTQLDLILVEGFRHEAFPKIELHRPVMGRPVLYADDTSIIAVATDDTLPVETSLPILDLNDIPALTSFVINYVARHS
ncbi:MAG: molybdopterin-guanine dinucleotide biosynthesis protein B [Candidatus Polarisedimenticolaceae bacterium]|nr:molybdopterin-guanine dinucleotide biosynthesis protein B [Candidatus Polarisedimenticolaceae bacterium]